MKRAYWLRVAAVSLTAAVLVTAMFVAAGRTTAVSVTLRHALIHSVIMAALAGSGVPWIRHRLDRFGATVQWTVTLSAALALAALGSGLACGVILFVEGGGRAAGWACFGDAFPIN